MRHRLHYLYPIILLCLSGCSSVITSGTPKVKDYSDQEIEQALNKYKPTKAEWIKTENKDQKTGIFKKDLDRDQLREGVAFFQEPSHKDQIGTLIVKKVNQEWKEEVFYDKGTKLEDVFIEDATGDKKLEIIMSIPDIDKQIKKTKSKDLNKEQVARKRIAVHTMNAGKHEVVFQEQCSEQAKSIDLDGDLKAEIICNNYESSKEKGEIKVYSSKNNQFQVVGSYPYDAPLSLIQNLTVGGVNKKKNGIFFSTHHWSSGSYTSILTMENGKLTDKLSSVIQSLSSDINFESISQDVNKDGIIEIPVSKNTDNKNVSTLPIIKWYQITEDNKVKLVSQTFDLPMFGVRLALPNKWWDQVQVIGAGETDSSFVSFLNKSVKEDPYESPKLLTIMFVFGKTYWTETENDLKKQQIPYKVVRKEDDVMTLLTFPNSQEEQKMNAKTKELVLKEADLINNIELSSIQLEGPYVIDHLLPNIGE